jgi:hypothetical protein
VNRTTLGTKMKTADQRGEPSPLDQHKPSFLVRFPAFLREPLRQLKKKTRRATTVDVALAVAEYLKTHGINVPDLST